MRSPFQHYFFASNFILNTHPVLCMLGGYFVPKYFTLRPILNKILILASKPFLCAGKFFTHAEDKSQQTEEWRGQRKRGRHTHTHTSIYRNLNMQEKLNDPYLHTNMNPPYIFQLVASSRSFRIYSFFINHTHMRACCRRRDHPNSMR